MYPDDKTCAFICFHTPVSASCVWGKKISHCHTKSPGHPDQMSNKQRGHDSARSTQHIITQHGKSARSRTRGKLWFRPTELKVMFTVLPFSKSDEAFFHFSLFLFLEQIDAIQGNIALSFWFEHK